MSEGHVGRGQAIEAPDIHELAALYRKAVSISDHRLAAVAEHALFQAAAAQAAIAEAQIIRSFMDESFK
jgi:hypothetical protein